MRGLPWLALLLLPVAFAADSSPPLSCGNVSPLGNQCHAGTLRITSGTNASVVVLGFVGHITIEAQQSFAEIPLGKIRWQCDALGAPALTTCGAPERVGFVAFGLPADVVCTASSSPGNPAPPIGPWGCEVVNN